MDKLIKDILVDLYEFDSSKLNTLESYHASWSNNSSGKHHRLAYYGFIQFPFRYNGCRVTMSAFIRLLEKYV